MNPDFREFFALLIRHDVHFAVIGGVAYNHYAPPRATKDIGEAVRDVTERFRERMPRAHHGIGTCTVVGLAEYANAMSIMARTSRMTNRASQPFRDSVMPNGPS